MLVFLRGIGCTPDDIHRLDPSGNEIALHVAAGAGNLAIAGELLEMGANVNAVKRLVGTTPLPQAVARGRYEMAEFLLEKGADSNAGSVPPLDEAVRSCNEPLVELLRRYGAKGTLEAVSVWLMAGSGEG